MAIAFWSCISKSPVCWSEINSLRSTRNYSIVKIGISALKVLCFFLTDKETIRI
jgi:hypothetical protein